MTPQKDEMPDEIWAISCFERPVTGEWMNCPYNCDDQAKYLRADKAPAPSGEVKDAVNYIQSTLIWRQATVTNRLSDDMVKAIETLIHAATQQSAQEVTVVTENKYIHTYIESVNKVGISDDCAVYNFLSETNKRHTKHIMEKYPNGLRIVKEGD